MSSNDNIERDPAKVDFVKDKRLFPDNPTSEDNLLMHRTKVDSQYFDPCMEASKMSLRCLERNNMERPPCKPYFEAYLDCQREFRERLKRS